MAAAGFCGPWFLFRCDTQLVGVHAKQSRDPLVFDCGGAGLRPAGPPADSSRDGGPPEEAGSDRVLAFAASASGRLLALTDDCKRLALFAREPTCSPAWRRLSVRWVARRCTALAFSRAEDELLAADKSGDVYSFSVVEAQREGQLRMGHLSMLLALALSPDDRYIITADRDEKIRVSRHRSPHCIQSFCLGHQQFVSALQIPPGHPRWLLSGSGDGTVKLWEYESGRRLQSLDLRQLEQSPRSQADQHKNPAICRVSCSPDGGHVAVHCERVSAVQLFTLAEAGGGHVGASQQDPSAHCPLDLTFDPDGRLWVLMDSFDVPLQIYSLTENAWQCESEDNPELCRVTEALRKNWKALEASRGGAGRFDWLYKESYDNVSSYLQKKQQRLEEQQLKRAGAPKANGSKRPKTEPSGTQTA
ncbi:LOW QUALITY PROTEIN: tRNA (guanine-N(7)-)-methyltransferase non-catalytic subunit wdr4 [Menidia menidia]